VLIWVFSGCLAVLLITAMVTDLRWRRLPNWLTGAVALLYVAFALVLRSPAEWPGDLMVSALAFAVGFALFAGNMMGGGDVKLVAGLALFAGPERIADFVLITALAGGLLALGYLTVNRLTRGGYALSGGPAVEPDAAAAEAAATDGAAARDACAISLPYGVAIAIGGFAIVVDLLQL
jgi:prepilin peptidase CpaA